MELNREPKPTENPTAVLVPSTSQQGFDDYDVAGIAGVHRITVGHGVKRGDICNVYCANSFKFGAAWKGDVVATLTHFAATHEGLHTLQFTLREPHEEQRRFGDLQLGESFFDGESGEFWTKVSDTTATMQSGGGQGSDDDIDEFSPDELVAVESPRESGEAGIIARFPDQALFSKTPQDSLDVTVRVLASDLTDIHKLRDESKEASLLVNPRDGDRCGPDLVKIEESLCAFFNVANLGDITQAMLDKARQEQALLPKKIPVVARYQDIFSKWYLCHAASYQNAFGSEVNGFRTRGEAVRYARQHGCVVEHHDHDVLQMLVAFERKSATSAQPVRKSKSPSMGM